MRSAGCTVNDIIDRNGSPIARNIQVYHAAIKPNIIKDKKKFLIKIKLLYPYKKDSLNFRMWKKYYSGASGLMGLKIESKSINSVRKFVNSLKLFGIGYSWGGFESLAILQDLKKKTE